MKLIATEVGRVILVFPVEEARPLAGLNLSDAVQLVSQRYRFNYPPDLSRWEDVQSGPIRFRSGKLESSPTLINIGEFEIYRDGLVATCSTTDASEDFLADFLRWGENTLGFRELRHPPRKWYSSTLVVDFDVDMNLIVTAYENMSTILQKALKEIYALEPKIDVFRLTVHSDPGKTVNSALLSEFTLERRVNYPYERQRFYCQAPLPTSRHVELLQQVEKIIAGRART